MSMAEAYPGSIRHEAMLLDQVQKVLYHVQRAGPHAAGQQALQSPERIPVVQLSKP